LGDQLFGSIRTIALLTPGDMLILFKS
jgi:hypothetical protein